MQLAIVIVNYRTPDLVIDCLASLDGPSAMPAGSQIVVVDGCSNDGSAERIATAISEHGWSGHVTLLPLSVNGGFAYGNNRGIERVLADFGKPDYFLLLNPDTVVRPGGILPLLAFMQANPKVGIAGSLLEDPDGTPQACAFRFPSVFSEFEGQIRFGPVTRLLSRWRVAPERPKVATRMGWVSGASMMVRAQVIDDIGFMDEDYFLYYEEVDFTLRAGRAGWECWHVPESRVVHLVGQSTGVTRRGAAPARRPAYWFDSRRRYFIKNHGRGYMMLADVAWLAGQSLWRVREILERRQRSDPQYIVRDFVRHSAFLRGL